MLVLDEFGFVLNFGLKNNKFSIFLIRFVSSFYNLLTIFGQREKVFLNTILF